MCKKVMYIKISFIYVIDFQLILRKPQGGLVSIELISV